MKFLGYELVKSQVKVDTTKLSKQDKINFEYWNQHAKMLSESIKKCAENMEKASADVSPLVTLLQELNANIYGLRIDISLLVIQEMVKDRK